MILARNLPRAATALLALMLVAPSALAEDDAADLLFSAPYLTELKPPSSLTYTFEHQTSDTEGFGEPFTDTITLDIRPPGEGHKLNAVKYNIFTGSRAKTIGPIFDVSGNPLTIIFLERDAFAMKRRAGGSVGLFRNAIRRAFLNKARIEDVTISLAGKALPARRITMKPFDEEKLPGQLISLKNKEYIFTIAEGVPGGIFSIESRLPSPAGGAEFLARDTVTFSEKSGG